MAIYIEGMRPHVINDHYFNRYVKFITHCGGRVLDEGVYVEKHHICPKSLGGPDEVDNLIHLSAREHFIAHWILWRAVGGKLANAFWMMSKRLNIRRSKVYEGVRVDAVNNISKSLTGELHPNYGKKDSLETRKRKSESMKGKNLGKTRSEEYKKSCSERYSGSGNPMYGKTRTHSEESKQKISESLKGRVISKKGRDNISNAKKGNKNPAFGKKWYHCPSTLDKKLLSSVDDIPEGWTRGMGPK